MLQVSPSSLFSRPVPQKGQNLVELLFTLPFFLLIVLYCIEFGRVWMTLEGTKMAVKAATNAAALYHSTIVGQTILSEQIALQGLNATSYTVKQVPNQHAYQADITVQYEPFFSKVKIPTLAGTVSILPTAFDMSYTGVTGVGVY
jgi:Flp pilus assembly protein TadG